MLCCLALLRWLSYLCSGLGSTLCMRSPGYVPGSPYSTVNRTDGLLSSAPVRLQVSGRMVRWAFLMLRTLTLRVCRLMSMLWCVRDVLAEHWRSLLSAIMLHPLVSTCPYAIMLKCSDGRGSRVPWLLLNSLALLLLPVRRGPSLSLRYSLGSLEPKPLRPYMSGPGMNSPCWITLIPVLMVFPLRLVHGEYRESLNLQRVRNVRNRWA